jgi:hypothetical protein
MLRGCAQLVSVVLLFAASGFAGSSGTFLGTMITTDDDHWIYVQSKNGALRRVDISSARVTYEAGVPRERRQDPAVRALKPGVEIRVTAEQDAKGEWRASQIEITGVSADMSGGNSPANHGGAPPDEQPDKKDAQPSMTLSPGCWAA